MLADDIDFSKKDASGNYLYESVVVETDDDLNPTSFVVMRSGLALSGVRKSESFSIPNVSTPFRKITLPDENVTSIISVKDSDDNEYFEVGSLTQDTVFKRIENVGIDKDDAAYNLEVRPAPYRFITNYDYDTKLTTRS